MIQIKDVSKNYGDFTAVENLSLEIRDGEIFGLLGPNGAGKSTTLKMITGITDITKGDIEIDGYSISKNPLKAKENFGFVMDTPDMFLRLKAIEYLTFIGKIYSKDMAKLKTRIVELSKLLDIYENLNDFIANMSHGMRQKIMVIGALVHDPKTWILDEPMTGLDPSSQHKIKELMRSHAENQRAVLFSTHVLEVAEKLCDRVGIINKGKLVFVGDMEELRNSRQSGESLEQIFLEITGDE